LVYVNARLFGRVKNAPAAAPRTLAMMIATGLGLHNLSEGLAIGQSAATGAIAFALVLVFGFALHNITEGFGIAAPLAADSTLPSWGFLITAGLIGGGPTFLGTMIGYVFTSRAVYVLFLALAAGALLYVINEMFHIGRRFNSPILMAWGLLLGFLLAYGTDLFLSYSSV
jgi:ZIP family zinc transporter